MKISQKRILIFIFLITMLFMPPAAIFPSAAALNTVSAAKIKLNAKSHIMLKGEKFTLDLLSTKEKPVYQSTNPLVATVNANGVIKAKGAGTAYIKVKTAKKTYKCKITVHDTMDIIVFAGQSNMTNVGNASQAPDVTPGTAYEAIPKKNRISHLTEPFGVGQPKSSLKKSAQGATLVSAFANAYYKQTKTPILAMNTAKGGTSIGQWSTSYYKEITNNIKKMEKLLKKKGLKKGHVYVVFFQGENDAMNSIVSSIYRKHMEQFMTNIQQNSDASRCFIIRIGNDLKNPGNYDKIAAVQTLLCMEDKRFVMAATIASGFGASYYQADGVHLTQTGLNKVGTQAGKNAGIYANTGKEPSMKDPRYNNTYHSKCN